MSNELIFPFSIAYETPKTLGTDRLAAVAGACFLFPQRAFLCIDAGTCITYDFLDSSGVYQGGAISPGLQMRLKALNHFTGRLPLVNFEGEKPELIGKSTQKSILSGAVNGFLAEIRATVQDYQEQFGKDLLIVVTGGDAEFICKSAGEFFYEPDLLLIGLDNICNLNTV
jgi:type III pantothenate kinase